MCRSSEGVVTLGLPDCALDTTDPGSVKSFRVKRTGPLEKRLLYHDLTSSNTFIYILNPQTFRLFSGFE